MCDQEAIGAPSTFSIIRSAATLVRMWPTLLLICEPVKIEGVHIHNGDTHVLAIVGIKEIGLEM